MTRRARAASDHKISHFSIPARGVIFVCLPARAYAADAGVSPIGQSMRALVRSEQCDRCTHDAARRAAPQALPVGAAGRQRREKRSLCCTTK